MNFRDVFSDLGGSIRAAGISALLLSTACGGPAVPREISVQFSPSGLAIGGLAHDETSVVVTREGAAPETHQGIRRGGTLLLDFEPVAGIGYRIGAAARDIDVVAPAAPAPALLQAVDLDPHFTPAARGDVAATASALTEDGRFGAVGSSTGDLVVIDFESGAVWTRRSPGAYMRSLAFHSDSSGILLYAGEQSPAGTMRCWRLDTDGPRELWRRETREEIGAGVADPDDPFAWAHQPGIYRILAREEAVYALASHSVVSEGRQFNAAALYALDPSNGSLRWRWPADEAYPGVATWCAVDDACRLLAISTYRRDGSGALFLLDAVSGSERHRFGISPLRPHVQSVSFWKSVAVAPGGEAVYLIANDGRAWIVRTGEEEPRLMVLGEPIPMGDVTILISGGGVAAHDGGAVFVTGVSYLPWEVASGERPPQPHPAANRAMAFTVAGARGDTAPLPNLAQGIAADEARRLLYIVTSSDPTYSPGGGSGLTIMARDPGPRVLGGYSFEGAAANVDPAIADHGLVLILEAVQRDRVGTRLIGRNAAHLLRW